MRQMGHEARDLREKAGFLPRSVVLCRRKDMEFENRLCRIDSRSRREVAMKKLWFCVFLTALCLLILSFSACRSESTAVNAEVSAENSTAADTENADKNWDIFSSVDVLCEEGDNYQIYTNAEETAYRYVVLDDNGETLDQGYHDWRGGFDFSEKYGFLQLTYGYGGPLWDVRYYDTARERVSPFFPKPLAAHGETVAYFSMREEEILLVVQNMFDPATYYKEFDRDFPPPRLVSRCIRPG